MNDSSSSPAADAGERTAPAWHWGVVALCVAAFIAISISSIRRKSITTDELPHITAGYSYVKTGSFRINPEHPPYTKLLAGFGLQTLDLEFDENWPSFRRALADKAQQFPVSRRFFFHTPKNLVTDPAAWVKKRQADPRALPDHESLAKHRSLLFRARLPLIFLSALFCIYMFLLARALWGPNAGLIAAVLSAFAPTVIAHGRLVTTDVGLTVLWVGATYHMLTFMRTKSRLHFAACSLTTGLALASKFSGILAPLIIGFVSLLSLALPPGPHRGIWSPAPRVKWTVDLGPRFVSWALHMCVYVAASLFVVACTYFFADVGYWFGGFGKVWVNHDPRYQGYFLGEHGSFFLTYFAVALLVKLPVGTLLLATIGTVWRKRDGAPLGWAERLLVLLPAAFIFAVTTYAGKYLGVRYVMPCIPLIILAASRVATLPWAKSGAGRLVPLVGCAAVVVSTSLAWPNYIPYFNEAAGGSENGVRLLDDSNVDWGQDWLDVAKYQRDHGIDHLHYYAWNLIDPGLPYGVRGSQITEDELLMPRTGWYCLSSHTLTRNHLFSYERMIRFDWLDTYEPVAILGGHVRIYRFWIDDAPPPEGFVGTVRTPAENLRDGIARLEKFVAERPEFVGTRQRLAGLLVSTKDATRAQAVIDDANRIAASTLDELKRKTAAINSISPFLRAAAIVKLQIESIEMHLLARHALAIGDAARARTSVKLAQAFSAHYASLPRTVQALGPWDRRPLLDYEAAKHLAYCAGVDYIRNKTPATTRALDQALVAANVTARSLGIRDFHTKERLLAEIENTWKRPAPNTSR